ncbi:MAG TPA: PDDEXK nuclease domain-containing protein [Thermoguttaceae bacterium]|nr:PDDEXK nuclease domain-containing protein [Thermoguttaceae bacterium]
MAKKKPSKSSAGRKPKKLAQPVRESRAEIVPQAVGQTPRGPGARIPPGYADLLEDLKDRIRHAQIRAATAVSRELNLLYFEIGQRIVQRQEQEGWGRSVIERLAADLQAAFPGRSGFSASNISRMRTFYLAYAKEVTNSAQPVPNLGDEISAQLVPDFDGVNLPRAVAEIPWGHNVALLFKLEDPLQRVWYAQRTIENGWSRAVLVHQIESDLFGRRGKALTNFERTLPAPQSDLARELVKDPYNFEFLGLATDASERELEQSLLEHLKNFFIELGRGFAFLGSQYHLEVAGEDYYLDLLFYHVHLRCFVVIELKIEDFKPEFAGKMNFYLSAVDDQLNRGEHNPSIGLILCKSHNRIVVEYALRDTNRPMGAATYRLLPKEMKRSLPSPTELKGALRGSVRISFRATGTLSNAGRKASDVATEQGHQEEAGG